MRKPFQGVSNIIRFNWHYYAIALCMNFLLLLISQFLDSSLQLFMYSVCILITASTLISLLASAYVYDLSGLYSLPWIDQQNTASIIVNISAGFDETSALLREKFPGAKLYALDFYNSAHHTEISIKRARQAYPPFPETKQVATGTLPLPDNSADMIFVILSAHEIRNEAERIIFFKELRRVIKPAGTIYITEHLRDVPNFLAYNFGFFHFYSRDSWHRVFMNAGLIIKKEIKFTPFISTFIINKNGNPS